MLPLRLSGAVAFRLSGQNIRMRITVIETFAFIGVLFDSSTNSVECVTQFRICRIRFESCLSVFCLYPPNRMAGCSCLNQEWSICHDFIGSTARNLLFGWGSREHRARGRKGVIRRFKWYLGYKIRCCGHGQACGALVRLCQSDERIGRCPSRTSRICRRLTTAHTKPTSR